MMRSVAFVVCMLVGVGAGADLKASSLPSQAFMKVSGQTAGELGAAVDGDPVYVAQGRRILTISVDDDDVAVVHASELLGGMIKGLVRVDDHLIAAWRSAEGAGQLSWFSLADPSHPQWVHDFAYHPGQPGRPNDLAVVGKTLYMTDLPEGPEFPPVWLFAIDASDPADPVVHEPLEMRGMNPKLAVLNEQYLLQSANFLALEILILDIGDPFAPEEVVNYVSKNNWGGATSVLAGGDYMVLLGTTDTEIVDLTSPADPELIAEIPGWINSAQLLDDHLVFGKDQAFFTWDLTDPADPLELSTMDLPFDTARLTVNGPRPSDALLFYPDGPVLQIDVTNPATPVAGSTIDLAPSSRIHSVATIPPGAATGNRQNSLHLYDLQLDLLGLDDPNLSSLNLRQLATRPDGLTLLVGEQIYVVDWQGFQPEIVGQLSLGDLPAIRTLQIAGQRAWATTQSIIVELDISDPSDPRIVQQEERQELFLAVDIAYADDHLYVGGRGATGRGELFIYRVEEGTAPELVGEHDGCGRIVDVEVSGPLAVVACGRAGVNWQIFDISAPETPTLLAEYPSEGMPSTRSVLFDDDRVWLGFNDYVDLVDLEDPNTPFLTARFHVPGRTFDLASAPSGAWVAANRGGIARLKAPDPLSPGQSAAWYDPERSGEGWVVEILDDDQAVGYWYTFDDDGNPRWLIGIGSIRDNRILFEMEDVRGGRFGPGFDPDEVESTPAGVVRMIWTGCEQGWFQYLPDEAVSLEIGINRLSRTAGVGECGSSQETINEPPTRQSGSWYDPAQAGQGFSLQWLNTGQALVTWYTFDAEGNPYWMIGVGQAEGEAIVFPELFSARGARFGEAFDPDDVELIEWGELRMQLDCLTGSAEYQSNLPEFGSGQFELERLTVLDGLSCD